MKNTWKKVLFSLGAIGLVGAGSLGLVNAQENTFGNPEAGTFEGEGLHGLNVVGEQDQYQSSRIIQTIKNFVNWILGMLSLIALILCLWGGFQMLTAGGDETKYKKGFTILKQAGLGLAIIGLSWLIVSVIFRLINKSSQNTPTGGNG